MSVLEIRGGGVELGGRPILRGIDLTIAQGEVVVVLGANGSGKSTLVRTLMGLVPASHGDVLLFDTPLTAFHDWQRVGFVPQRATAAGGVPASVWEVVASGRLSRRRIFRSLGRRDRVAVDEAIEAVGLSDKARDSVSTLSGGQQQRTLIARALAGEPDVLVLDEPTTGVDVASQEAFARALAALAGRGATIVLVAHDLGPVAPLIGRAVVMRDGRVAYDGPPTAAVTAPHVEHGHHHPDETRSDHVPAVASPIDRSPETAR